MVIRSACGSQIQFGCQRHPLCRRFFASVDLPARNQTFFAMLFAASYPQGISSCTPSDTLVAKAIENLWTIQYSENGTPKIQNREHI